MDINEGPRSTLEHLGMLVRDRRLEIGWNRDQAAQECQLSPMTYRRVEGGEPTRSATYAKIENKFGFVTGSCIAFLDGADGIPMTGGAVMTPATASIPSALMESEIRKATILASVATLPDLTVSQVRDLSEGIVKELKVRGCL
ncbi:helix-turn-helix domain-containing protein [Streptomyces sp. NBC_01433]|uniref:helix-turn-helix domain-containing protein n=1 Tax=Streptomyces sp. NBC_01433 TaxID=2903864 RepID=UPI0022535165|nr:helix-turn-helix transcriptional regulator [Streptomyces sp. NBC_01433]MCX4681681.1 helix-turn-helix domain-containing protein [Streptomyces sp. NBC_01433]